MCIRDRYNYIKNQSKDEFNPKNDFIVSLELENTSPDTSSVIINLSPNDWDQSWNHITAKAYRGQYVIFDVVTGYNFNPIDKPVHSSMNLLSIEILPKDHITLLVHLEGIPDSVINRPESIDFTLIKKDQAVGCLLYTSPSPRDRTRSRMPSSA